MARAASAQAREAYHHRELASRRVKRAADEKESRRQDIFDFQRKARERDGGCEKTSHVFDVRKYNYLVHVLIRPLASIASRALYVTHILPKRGASSSFSSCLRQFVCLTPDHEGCPIQGSATSLRP